MELERAKIIADNLVGRLAPYCEKIEIAGSVRRKKPYVKDIEVVCIPRANGKRRDAKFCNVAFSLGVVVIGKLSGKYCRLRLPENIFLDLFIAEDNNWGLILTIRTGPKGFSKNILARFNLRGYHSEAGYPKDSIGNRLEFQEEKEVFEFLDMSFIPPHRRI